jgi:hypothetical protein
MEIQAKHNSCIWCGHPFAIKGFRGHSDEVVRSREHIIPANIFGRLKTTDVCVGCNSRLGSEVDDRLLDDFYIFQAGVDAGYKPEELLPSFRVCGSTPDGEPFEYRVKDGRWRLRPSFHETGFKIGAVNGSSTPEDLENAKRKMLRLVREDRRLNVSAAEAEGFIDELFKTFLERQGQHTIYQERIKQGLRARPIPSKGTITKTTHPWETQWAIAKMLCEVSDTMLPGRLRRIIHSALQQLRVFLSKRELRKGIFQHRTLKRRAEPQHLIQIVMRGSKLRFVCRLFGREQWSLSFAVLRRDVPARLDGYELRIINHCKPERPASVEVFENGQPVECDNP